MFSYNFNKKIDQILVLLLLLCGIFEKKFELSFEGSLIFHLSLGNGI
jgi:hypothetical protein